MSRRKEEQSNTPRIGIFTDKSAVYNLATLEILYKLNMATSWQIAKKIAEKQKRHPDKDAETQARRIYSVIQRKKGRLPDLENKGYIAHTSDGLWQLTLKGVWALAL